MSRFAIKSLFASAMLLALCAAPALADGPRHGGGHRGHGSHGGWKGDRGGHHHHHGGGYRGYRGNYNRYNPGCYPRYGYYRAPSYYYLAPPIWVQPRSALSFSFGW